MAIKINTAYKEILTSSMLNEKISGVVGGNEKVNGFDVSISTPTSVSVKPGKAYVNGCSIEETSETKTISLNSEMTSTDGIVYVVLTYIHETKNVEFTCVKTVNTNMVKLATLVIKDGAITELVNHESINTLNTVIGVSADIEAQKIRDAIPSGFTELGQLDYNFMSSNENKVKIKGKSIAYVNGYRVEIPAGTVVDIGKAPEKESREDLLFLEAWKDSDFAKNGKLKWRIRHVAGVDFKTFRDGFGYASTTINGVFYHYDYDAIAQGGLSAVPNIITPNSNSAEFGVHCFYSVSDRISSVNTGKKIGLNDKGLYLAGTGDSNSKNTLNTVDGYSYAIPMFRLYRKPSCGQSTPFEYSKINPTVDYSKCAELLKEEKIERVVTENIQGRSLVNVSSEHPGQHTNDVNTLTNPFNIKVSDVTVIVYNMPAGKKLSISECNATTEAWITNTFIDISAENPMVYIPQKPNTLYSGIVGAKSDFYGNWTLEQFKNTKILALKGDWTNRDIPKYFKSVTSLGEDDGNVITIKNGILSDDTYDINDGKQKLNTFPEVTHILSKNTIIPKIEAVVTKGETQKSAGQLGAKLDTDGTEVIEFTRIKGRTIQNCYPQMIQSSFSSPEASVANGYVTLQGTGEGYKNAFIPLSKCVIKPNTKYTIVVHVTENTLKKSFVLASTHADDAFNSTSATVGKGAIGTYKYLVISKDQFTASTLGLRPFLSPNETGKIVFKAMLLEGDHTNSPLELLPFVDGIKSVGENENNKINIVSHGKNLFKVSNIKAGTDCGINFYPTSNNTLVLNGTNTKGVDIHFQDSTPILLKRGTKYTIKAFVINGTSSKPPHLAIATKSLTASAVSWLDSPSGEIVLNDTQQDTLLSNIRLHHPNGSSTSYNNCEIMIQVVEGESRELAKYKEHVQNIYMKEPLRSLSDAVYDEIIENKVIRRVGKLVLNGSENWVNYYVEPSGLCRMMLALNNYKTSTLWCDTLPTVGYGDSWTKPYNCISGLNNAHIILYLKVASASAFRTWLSQNPTTVYYELKNPIEERLENVYEKESVRTYQLNAPLRSLPNGVKDEITDTTLIRRCGGLTINKATVKTVYYENMWDTSDCYQFYSSTLKSIATFPPVTAVNVVADTMAVYSQRDLLANVRKPGIALDVGCSVVRFLVPKTTINAYEGSSVRDKFLNWLDSNPIKISYELAVPIKLPLTEAIPQTADFSPQRQCAEGTWLRELPNGVKDTVENGKVIRRVGRKVINGTESWTYRGGAGNPNIVAFSGNGVIPCSTNEHVKNMISDTLPSIRNGNVTTEGVVNGVIDSYAPIVFVDKRKLSSVSEEGFKEWLSKNPMTVLFELKQTTEEALTTGNHMPYPYHEINTYCGSMYVGEGRNYAVNINKMPSEDSVVIETDFRKIEGGARVEDCKYKKCDDGYDTAYAGSSTINVVDLSSVPSHRIEGDYIKFNTKGNTSMSMFVGVYPNNATTNYLSHPTKYDDVFTTGEARKYRLLLGINGNAVDDKIWVELNLEPYTTYYKTVVCEKLDNNSCRIRNIIISKGSKAPNYVPFIPTTKYFENTEENDIEDLRYQVSLTGFNYDKLLNESFDKLLRGML